MLGTVLRRLLLRPAVTGNVGRLLHLLGANSHVVFTLHRFAREEGGRAYPVSALRDVLASLRRDGVAILPLSEMLTAPATSLPQRAVAFTVDDGYADFVELGLATFRAFDVPVTVFVPTQFMDGGNWLWWDRLEAAIQQTRTSTLSVDTFQGRHTYEIRSSLDRVQLASRVSARLERLPTNDRLQSLEQVLDALEVSLPEIPPPEYQAMGWPAVRRLSQPGEVDFGPHSVTHPILSLCDSVQSRWEISESWTALKRQVPDALPIFCYPNGSPWAFGERETEFIAEVGCSHAVSTRHGYLLSSTQSRFRLPRMALPVDTVRAAWIGSGLQQVSLILRMSLRGRNES